MSKYCVIGAGPAGLASMKTLVDAGHVRATASAFEGALALGINNLEGMCAIILALRAAEHYKSMTTHGDHRIWQDVSRGITADGIEVYLKLTVIDDLLIVSFKEL